MFFHEIEPLQVKTCLGNPICLLRNLLFGCAKPRTNFGVVATFPETRKNYYFHNIKQHMYDVYINSELPATDLETKRPTPKSDDHVVFNQCDPLHMK